MKDEVRVTNIMADGTICKDLSTYLDDEHQLPELTKRIMLDMIRAGQKLGGSGG